MTTTVFEQVIQGSTNGVKKARRTRAISRAWNNVKSKLLDVGGFALVSFGIWSASEVAGLVAGGISMLVLNWSWQRDSSG